MEMNTRLQVEHPVTEAVAAYRSGRVAAAYRMGEQFTRRQSELRFYGHAIEARLCAEDPARDFLPQAGRDRIVAARRKACAPIMRFIPAREISPFYDSMIAKVIAHGATRDAGARAPREGAR